MDDNLDLKYERLLGEGSYGKVFLVGQQDGQKFAVKEIDLCKCDNEARSQALAEATLLSRVKHDNILAYIESVMNDDCLYIITEFCGGGDLEDYLEIIQKAGHTVPEPLVSEWVLQIGGALKYLHDLRILHRDMKTKNIFLKDDLTVKLGDLGIAKVLDLNQSKANTFIGTPSYMSPELFTGKPYNHKTDIWGLGCCAYEMLTLKKAFQGKALWTLIREIKNGRELDLPDQYSLELRALIQEMMSQNPELRPSANNIVENDYLVYHRGTAKKVVSHLPSPNKKDRKKKGLPNSLNNLSGSFDRMLQQKNKVEDDRLRKSVISLSEKMTTLRKTVLEDDEMSTFVYHRQDSSDEQPEASNTILDSNTLKQFTEQLDTFVFKGDFDSDSDYYTGQFLDRKGQDQGQEDLESNKTLITQYSNTLEEMENNDNGDQDVQNKSVNMQGDLDSVNTQGDLDSVNTHCDLDIPNSRLVQSTIRSRKLDETLTSRYSKYNMLRDTIDLTEGKPFRRNQSETSGNVKNKHLDLHKTTENGSKQRSSKYLSTSFSEAKTLHAVQSKDSKQLDHRLNRTTSSDGQPKMKICDRLEQSFLSKSQSRKGLTKIAFSEEETKPLGDLDVSDVMMHLKDKLTLYTDDSVVFDKIKGQGQDEEEVFDDKGSPTRKGKKKNQYIKKQAAKKKSSESDSDIKVNVSPSTENNVTLFTRAQSVSYNKDSDVSCVVGNKSRLQVIVQLVNNGGDLTNEHLLFIHRELAKGIGVDTLNHVMYVMSIVNSEEELKVYLASHLGPKVFNEYMSYLLVLHHKQKMM